MATINHYHKTHKHIHVVYIHTHTHTHNTCTHAHRERHIVKCTCTDLEAEAQCNGAESENNVPNTKGRKAVNMLLTHKAAADGCCVHQRNTRDSTEDIQILVYSKYGTETAGTYGPPVGCE